MPETEALAAEVKDRAQSMGFDLAGIAPAAAFPEARHYKAWLSMGRHGSLGYMARCPERRMDIRNWHPGARSVVMLATAYPGEISPAPYGKGGTAPYGDDGPNANAPSGKGDPLRFDRRSGGDARGAQPAHRHTPSGDDASYDDSDPAIHGSIARYALSPDYHDTLAGRMQDLASFIRVRRPGTDVRAFVDTSPILERLHAYHAGLGWVGKNGMIVSPEIGSYSVLSGLSLDLELPFDKPMADRCGSCSRCLEACPTRAFPEPRSLDASRCISLLTMKHRGPIPESLRAPMGNRLFGCDACQEACPWNRPVGRASPGRVLESPILLEEAAAWDEDEFAKKTSTTPVARAGWRGFMRNVLLAVGNSGNIRLLPILERYTSHPDPVLKEQALWSRAKLKNTAIYESGLRDEG